MGPAFFSLTLLLGLASAPPESDEAGGTAPAAARFVDEILGEGFGAGGARLPAIEKKLESARRPGETDPRADYAGGLLLLANGHIAPAQARFEAAVGREGPAYWPAWQALLWTQFARQPADAKRYDAGLDRLIEFATLVGQSAPVVEAAARRRDAACWIGRIFEGLVQVAGPRPSLAELVARRELPLATVLGDGLREEFDRGRQIVAQRALELDRQARDAQAAAAETQARRRERDVSRLAETLQDLHDQKQKAEKSVAEWKEWLDENLAKANKDLGRLEKDYQFLAQRGQSLDRSTLLGLHELSLLEERLFYHQARRGGDPTGRLARLAQPSLALRQNSVAGYRLQSFATNLQMAQVVAQGQQGAYRRAEILAKYQKEAGELSAKIDALDKRRARLAERKQTLEQPPANRAAGVKLLPSAKQQSLKAYVPLDLEVERVRVLADCGIKSVPPPAGTNDGAEFQNPSRESAADRDLRRNGEPRNFSPSLPLRKGSP